MIPVLSVLPFLVVSVIIPSRQVNTLKARTNFKDKLGSDSIEFRVRHGEEYLLE